jgi:hypothetical protein
MFEMLGTGLLETILRKKLCLGLGNSNWSFKIRERPFPVLKETNQRMCLWSGSFWYLETIRTWRSHYSWKQKIIFWKWRPRTLRTLFWNSYRSAYWWRKSGSFR